MKPSWVGMHIAIQKNENNLDFYIADWNRGGCFRLYGVWAASFFLVQRGGDNRESISEDQAQSSPSPYL